MDFSFKADYSFFFIPLTAIVSAAVAFFYYKNSLQDPLKKKLFTALRFLSVFFILLLLLTPVISYFKNTLQKPVNVYLIDNSQSLILENRAENLSGILSDKVVKSLPGNSENIFYLFSGNLDSRIDESGLDLISYKDKNNFATNLTSALNSIPGKIPDKNISSVTVISDGIITEGGNPVKAAKSLNAPVNYFLVGDTVQKNDLVLANVFFNRNAFIESSVPVKAEINSYNYNREIRVNLYEEDKLADSKTISVNSESVSYEIQFSLFSSAVSVRKYKIEIEGLDNEITFKNNAEEFFVDFSDNKFKVLVLAGAPGPDVAFFREEISKIKNFETVFLTQKSAGEYYEGSMPDLSQFDSYIFLCFPTAITNSVLIKDIKDNLERNGSSLLFFSGRNTDYKKLELIQDKLPFKVSALSDREEETVIKNVSSINPELFGNTSLPGSVNNFPAIYRTTTVFTANPSAEIILLSGRNSEPAFLTENTLNNKSAAFLAYGFYKWRLSSLNNNSDKVLNSLISNSLIYVTDKNGRNRFKLETGKQVYSKYENVIFKAVVTGTEIPSDPEIQIQVTGKDYSNRFTLAKRTGRNYEGEINIPVNGDYEYTGELKSGNSIVQSLKGRFLIGENNYEFKSTKADNSVLNMLSVSTGGSNFTASNPGDIMDIINVINENPKSEFRTVHNIDFSINPFYLTCVILLLCSEWFFRKRNNLP